MRPAPPRAGGEARLPCPQGAYILLRRCDREEKQLVKEHDVKKSEIVLLYETEKHIEFQEAGRLSRGR